MGKAMKTFRDFGIHVPDVFSGERYSTCPKCSPTRKKSKVKCLAANGDKGVWICHHCSWSGTLDQGERTNSNPKYWERKDYRRPDFEKTDLPTKTVDWFGKRGISPDVLARHGISYGRAYMPQVEAYANVVKFPFYKNGKVVNVKYRDNKKNFKQEPHAEQIVFNFDNAVGCDFIIICEGEIDALSFAEIGLTAVSVPNGAPPPNAKNYESEFTYLESLMDTMERCNRVYLAVDNDEPGQKLEAELARRIGKEKCWRLEYPAGCKDANEILVKRGKEGLEDCFEAAQPYPIEGIISVDQLEKDVWWLYNNGFHAGKTTGWRTLDEHYRIREGEMTVLTGIPSHGKSTFLDDMLIHLAERWDWKFAVFTPENLPLERHVAGLAEKHVAKPFDKGYTTRMTEEEMVGAVDFIREKVHYILPHDDFSIDQILMLARACVYRYGVKGVILDPWNEMEHKRPSGMTETEYISSVLSKIRRFARLHEVHFWIVAHPTKLSKMQDEDGKWIYPVPTPYDISGSAHWRNKADNCLAVWRDVVADNNLVEVHIQKIRFKENGRPGKVVLKFDRPTGCFSEIGGATLSLVRK